MTTSTTQFPITGSAIFSHRVLDAATTRLVIRLLIDAITIAFGLIVVVVLRSQLPLVHHWLQGTSKDLTATLLGYLGIFLWIAYRYGLYRAESLSNRFQEQRLIVQSCLSTGLILCGVLFLFHTQFSRWLVLLLVICPSGTLCLERTVRRVLQAGKSTDVVTRNVAILGVNQLCYALSEHMNQNPQFGYNFVGFVNFPGSKHVWDVAEGTILGSVVDLEIVVRRYFVEEIVIAEFYPTEKALELIEVARELDVDVRAISGYYPEFTAHTRMERLGVFPVTPLHRCASRTIGQFFKRIGDIVLAAIALIIAALPMALVALAIKLDTDGPVFYASMRIGKRGRPFRCYKFRTMVANADALKKCLLSQNEREGVLFKMANDPRVTRLGRFLRKYSIDELPQLANVLAGDMSMVGPRPPIEDEVEKYQIEHLHRLQVLPGLTGLWQVQARKDRSFSKYIALDMAYVENWNFWLDLKILLRTVDVVLRGTGV